MEVPVTVQANSLSKKKVVSGSLCDIGSKRQNSDFGSWLCGISVLEDSSLLKKVNIFALCSPPTCLQLLYVIFIFVFPRMF